MIFPGVVLVVLPGVTDIEVPAEVKATVPGVNFQLAN